MLGPHPLVVSGGGGVVRGGAFSRSLLLLRTAAKSTSSSKFVGGGQKDLNKRTQYLLKKVKEPPTPVANAEVRASQEIRYIARYIWGDNWKGRLQLLATIAAIVTHKWLGLQAPQAMARLTDRLAGPKMGPELAAAMMRHGHGGRRGHHHHHSPAATTATTTPQPVCPHDHNNGDSEDAREILSMVAEYVVTKYGASLFQEIRSGIFGKLTSAVTERAAQEAFEHLLKADLDFILSSRTGELIPVIEKGSKAVGNMLSNLVLRLMPMTIELTMLKNKLNKRNAKLTWVTYSTLAAYFGFTMAYSELRVRYRLRNTQATNKLKGVTHESLLNAEVVRLMGTAETEKKRYNRAAAMVHKSRDLVSTSLSKLNAGQQLILQGGTGIALAMTANKVFSGEAKVGELVSISQIFHQVAHPLHFVGTMYREFKTDYADIKEMMKVLNHPATIVDKPDAKDLVINRGSVVLDNVSFSYPRQVQAGIKAIDGVSLRVYGGSHIAIVGPSGGGKSTVAKLIARLYDPQNGSVSICGQDVRDVTVNSVRRAIGSVPQDTILFNETLLYNIIYGNPNATDAEIDAAIKAAQLDKTVAALPDGLHTLVGERGSRLSGGERQRVALARCFLKKPAIVVLDEATSNLDAHTEKDIMVALKTLIEGRTSIMVAHRLSTVTDADQIFFMDKGRIVEAGNHTELLAKNGRYAAMWREQQEAYDQQKPSVEMSGDEIAGDSAGCCPTGCTH